MTTTYTLTVDFSASANQAERVERFEELLRILLARHFGAAHPTLSRVEE
jgi:hypothetical protein